jgi:hypothetical protein
VNAALHAGGMTGPEIADAVRGRLGEAWRERPLDMARDAWRRVRWSDLPGRVLDPFDAVQNLMTRTGPATPDGMPARLDYRPAAWLEPLRVALRVLAAILFWAFLAGPLLDLGIRLFRRAQADSGDWLRAALVLWYVAFIAAYAVVHIERRYLLPATAVALAVGAANLSRWTSAWTGRSRLEAPSD